VACLAAAVCESDAWAGIMLRVLAGHAWRGMLSE
jgi:hypothetical protein